MSQVNDNFGESSGDMFPLLGRKNMILFLSQLLIQNPNYYFTATTKINAIHNIATDSSSKRPDAIDINPDKYTKPCWYTIFVGVTNVSVSRKKHIHLHY